MAENDSGYTPGSAPGATIPPPGGGSPGAPGGGGGGTVQGPAGGIDVTLPLVPIETAPRGFGHFLRDGPASFRFILSQFEGVNEKQSAADIGELQAQTITNFLTDEQSLKKRSGSEDVNTSGSSTVIGLHEVSGLRELAMHNIDDSTGWIASDPTNFYFGDDPAGTQSLIMYATGNNADGDTIRYERFGVTTGVNDLRAYDYVEATLEGTTGRATVTFGVSEDNVTYYNAPAYQVSTAGVSGWQTVQIDLTGVPATALGIRHYRFLYTANSDGTARQIRADNIRAVKRTSHFLRALRLTGTPSGGPRNTTVTVGDVVIQSNRTKTWENLATYTNVPVNVKVRMVDWLGTTYAVMGPAGNAKFSDGLWKNWYPAPPGWFIEQHLEKLWIWNINHALRHSDLSNPEAWPTATDPTGLDGGLIYVGRQYTYLPTGMKAALGNLYLWTEGDLWILFGTDNSNFYLQRAHPGSGTLSHESIVKTDSGLLWHDGLRNRILKLEGGDITDISDPIRPTLEAIPAAMKPWTAALFDGRYYLFSYCRAGQTANDRTYAYDLLLQRWHGPFEGDWVGFNVGLIGVDGARYVAGAHTRKILTGATDNGSAISVAWKSKAFDFRMPRVVKRLRRLWVRAKETTATITAHLYRNQETSPVRSYTLAFTGSPVEVQRTAVHDNVEAELLTIELTESSTTNAVTIMEVGVDGYIKRTQR